MRERTCEGYTIIQAVMLDHTTEIVVGYNPDAYQPYVCWFSSENGYDTGRYCFDFKTAMKNLAERLLKYADYIPHDYFKEA